MQSMQVRVGAARAATFRNHVTRAARPQQGVHCPAGERECSTAKVGVEKGSCSPLMVRLATELWVRDERATGRASGAGSPGLSAMCEGRGGRCLTLEHPQMLVTAVGMSMVTRAAEEVHSPRELPSKGQASTCHGCVIGRVSRPRAFASSCDRI